MLGSSKKKLLVSGCSFTASGEHSHVPKKGEYYLTESWRGRHDEYLEGYDNSFKKWPEIVSEQLNLKLVNLARCGNSNERIAESLMEYILKNGHDDIEMVLVGWTEFNRFLFETAKKTSYFKHDKKYKMNITSWRYGGRPQDDLISWQEFREKFEIVRIEQDIKTIFLLQEFLEIRNIKYKFFSLLRFDNVHLSYSDKQFFQRVVNNEFFKQINEKNFYGWPVFTRLGGKSAFNGLPRNVVKEGFDGHPNKRGHRMIAKNVLDFIE